MQKKLIIFPLIFIAIFVYAYFLEIFFAKYLWLFFGIFVYLVFFIVSDSSIKRKQISEKLKLKDREERRIDFWKCFSF